MSEHKTLIPVMSAAIDLYKPPFSYYCGYIKDGNGKTVADDGPIDELSNMIAARVRGWGRIQHIEGDYSPEQLQDSIGEHIANALNEYWPKHMPPVTEV